MSFLHQLNCRVKANPLFVREKRRKNNEAARRSREKKRKFEIELEEKVLELKEENDRFIRFDFEVLYNYYTPYNYYTVALCY